MAIKRQFNLKRAPFDPRDADYAYHLTAQYRLKAAAPLPSSWDNSAHLDPVRDQGQRGACAGFSSTAARSYADYQQALKQSLAWPTPRIYSPDYVYDRARILDGTWPNDDGTNIRTVMQVLQKYGACLEAADPYKDTDRQAPTTAMDADATTRKIISYHSISTGSVQDLLQAMKVAIAAGNVVVGGIQCYAGIMDAPKGLVPLPSATEQSEGGHALPFAAFDDARAVIKFKNSWSTAWGDAGYGYLPYEYFANSKSNGQPQVWDCYVIDAIGDLNATPVIGGTTVPGVIQVSSFTNKYNLELAAYPLAQGGERIQRVHVGSYIDFKLNVATAGVYTATFPVSLVGAPHSSFAVLLNGAKVADVTVSATKNHNTFVPVSTALTLASGVTTLRILATGKWWNLGDFSVKAAP